MGVTHKGRSLNKKANTRYSMCMCNRRADYPAPGLSGLLVYGGGFVYLSRRSSAKRVGLVLPFSGLAWHAASCSTRRRLISAKISLGNEKHTGQLRESYMTEQTVKWQGKNTHIHFCRRLQIFWRNACWILGIYFKSDKHQHLRNINSNIVKGNTKRKKTCQLCMNSTK